MKRFCYLGILKEGLLAYSCPVMLVSRKVTKYKSVVTDFRHLNVIIAKNTLLNVDEYIGELARTFERITKNS